jgi:hypothetical protein
LDGDDWWAPQKIQVALDTLYKNPDIGAVGHGYHKVDLINQKSEIVAPDCNCRLTFDDAAGARRFLALGGFLGGSLLTVRKLVLDRIVAVPEELTFCADGFIFTLAVGIAGAVILARPLSYYRVHEQNLFQTANAERLRRGADMQECCARRLIPELVKLGLPRDAIAVLALASRLNSESLQLSRHGRNPWCTFQNERARNRLAYRGGSLGYRVFKALVLGLTLLMPPVRFYELKQWYARKGLWRIREKLGSPVCADPIQILPHPIENLIEPTDARDARYPG